MPSKKEKAQPKSAADTKHPRGPKAKQAVGAAGGKGKKPVRGARPAKKTEEELDIEMAEYFNSTEAAPAATGDDAAATGVDNAAPGGADASMDDEIS